MQSYKIYITLSRLCRSSLHPRPRANGDIAPLEESNCQAGFLISIMLIAAVN